MKLRLDEMVPVRVARELRRAGFDVDAVVEHPHLRGLPDGEQLAWAAPDGRAFVTYDAGDLLPLALDRTAKSHGHAGLVLLRSPRFSQAEWRALVRGLVDLLEGPEAAADVIHWLE